MKKYKIELGNDPRVIAFIRETIQEKHATCTEIEGTGRVEFQLEDRELYKKIVTETMIVHYKRRTVLDYLRERKELSFYAYVGAVLATEKEEERETILQKIIQTNIINLDGLYHFAINGLRTSWEKLGVLAERLYGECRSEEDKTALITYMLQLDEGGGQILTVCGENLIGKAKLRLYDFFEGEKENFVANLLYGRPSEIIVTTPERVDEDVFRFIARLSD